MYEDKEGSPKKCGAENRLEIEGPSIKDGGKLRKKAGHWSTARCKSTKGGQLILGRRVVELGNSMERPGGRGTWLEQREQKRRGRDVERGWTRERKGVSRRGVGVVGREKKRKWSSKRDNMIQ